MDGILRAGLTGDGIDFFDFLHRRDILLIGINHKTAPVELRECIAFDKDESSAAHETLRRTTFILEARL